MRKLAGIGALVLSLGLVAGCGETDTETAADAGGVTPGADASVTTGPATLTAKIDGSPYSVTKVEWFHSVGTIQNGTKVGSAIRSEDATRALTLWFGLDANGKVVPGTYEIVPQKSQLAPGKGMIEYHADKATMMGTGRAATSGTLVLESVHEEPSVGFRGGKGTFSGIIPTIGPDGQLKELPVTEGQFEVHIPANQ